MPEPENIYHLKPQPMEYITESIQHLNDTIVAIKCIEIAERTGEDSVDIPFMSTKLRNSIMCMGYPVRSTTVYLKGMEGVVNDAERRNLKEWSDEMDREMGIEPKDIKA
jgi:hypothetical protein